MTDIQSQFEKSQKDVRRLTKTPSDADLLAVYALFKQATEGDATGVRPGMLKIRDRAKYDAWDKLKGSTRDEAMQQYVAKVEELKNKLG